MLSLGYDFFENRDSAWNTVCAKPLTKPLTKPLNRNAENSYKVHSFEIEQQPC